MTSQVRLIRSESLAPAPYAHAATAPAGTRFVFLAGACPLTAEGTTVAPGDPAGQARVCLDNLEEALAAAEVGLADVISTRVSVASSDRADLVAAWQVVAEHFGEHDVPSTLVGVACLGYPDQLVEIEAVAAAAG